MKKQDGEASKPTLADLQHVYNLFFPAAEVTEIRAFGLYGNNAAWTGYAKGTVSGWFDNATAFAKAALVLDRAGATGVYFAQNPVNPALLARAQNRLKAAEVTTADKDIVCLRHLYLDFDPERPKGISATDGEIELARQSMENMRKHLEGVGWPEGLGAFSGNGRHCVHWLPDLPNDREHSDLIKKALEAAHHMFSTDRVKVDTVVFNPSRIGKLYGSTSRKGDDTADRPHRRSYIDPACSNGWRPQALTIEQLKWLADQAPKADRNQERTGSENGRLDVARYLKHYGRPFRVKEQEAGTGYTLDVCPFKDEHTGTDVRGDSEIIQQASGKLLFKCFHDHCAGRTWADVRKKISGNDLLAPFTEGANRADGSKQDGSGGRVTANEEWPEPGPLDQHSSLPDFPVEALSGIGRDIVEKVAEVNQVDPALPASLYLGALSTCCARKSRIDLITHSEPLNLYLCPISGSGTRKSSTQSVMVQPCSEYQKNRQEAMSGVIREAQNALRIKEKRLEKLQKRAADEDDSAKRRRVEQETSDLVRNMAENPLPKAPIYLVDDITSEKLGVIMAENGERMGIISPKGGLFEIMAGLYSKDGVGNIDLLLKAHTGDCWSSHRIGREAQTMEAPALTLCLAVQSEVIEEAGKNHHFRGKGLLARFLYARCKSQIGYRERQTIRIPPALIQTYKNHVFSLMDMPFFDTNLRLSTDGQSVWDELYNDVEREMRPGESLEYLPDWGSKLPGEVARIAGLLHFAEHGPKAVGLPISVNIVGASAVIGAYFKEHAIAVFQLMQEDTRLKLARQILQYIGRIRPETFRERDVLRHTCIPTNEDVKQGLKVLADRRYIREEVTRAEMNRPEPGRPSSKTYRVNPRIFERTNV